MFRENWEAFRQNWNVPAFWRWWWRERVTLAAKLSVLSLALLLLITAGYFTSVRLTAAHAANETSSPRYIVETTVTRIVTTKQNGKTVVTRVPVVVKRTLIKSKTALATVVDREVVTTPGKRSYIVRTVVQKVPVVHRQVVRVGGQTTTLTETRLVPTVHTETQTIVNTVTNQSTVVQNHTTTTTNTNTVTQPVTTIQVHTVTRNTTTTLPAKTVTTTRTETQTKTETRTQTQTQTVVQTVTQPGVTITITLPLP